MKYFARILVMIGVLAAISGCSDKKKDKGGGSNKIHRDSGSVVGNGLRLYHNPVYDFSFRYNESLAFASPSHKEIRLDNSPAATGANGRTSGLSFFVKEVEGLNLASLHAYATQKGADLHWVDLSISGVPGVVHKDNTSGGISQRFIFLLGSGLVLEVT